MKKKKRFQLNEIQVEKFLKFAVFAFAISFFVIYLWVVVSRIKYPYELEWIEGGILEQVQRLVKGQGIYIAPSIDFVPFLYPPGYFYLAAVFSSLIGDGFFPLRIVSFTASLISFVVIFLIVKDETKNWWVSLLSSGLFAAAYRVTGAWLDIARVDSLFLALLLFCIYFVRKEKSYVNTVFAGIFAALTFLTKQTALIAIIPIVLYLFWRNWKYALCFLTTAVVLAGTITLILNQRSDGWYIYYVFTLLSQQTQWLPLEFLSFWKNDLIVHLPITLLLTGIFIFSKTKQERVLLIRWLAILAGALAATFLSRVKIGGYDNVLLPMFAVFSILFGLGLHELQGLIDQQPAVHKSKEGILLQTACLLQFAILFYNPFTQIPTKADLTEGQELVQYLSTMDESVYMPDHGYLLTLAGKRTFAHHGALWDVLRTDELTAGKVQLSAELEEAIRDQTYDVIILDAGGNFCCRAIDQYYTKVGEIFDNDISFFPVTGDKRRPTYIYEANRLR